MFVTKMKNEFGIKISQQEVKIVLKSSKPLLTRGNTKLGEILTIDLPAVITCPGRTEACSGGKYPRCYATKGWFRSSKVKFSQLRNLLRSLDSGFVKKVVAELNRRSIPVVRVHSSGDFYSQEYLLKWEQVFQRCPDKVFYFYTRSWKLPEMRVVLERVATLPNVTVFYSLDTSSTAVGKIGDNVRLTYLQTHEDDISDQPVDLVFRDHPLRTQVVKTVNGSLVCPLENGITTELTCRRCGICWDRTNSAKDPRHHRKSTHSSRFSLPLVS